MSSFRTVMFALPLIVVAALTGCAANSASEDTADATGAATASSPITIANYISHPKIQTIRAEVAAMKDSELTKTENPGCDGTNTKWADAAGTIRHFKSDGGEGGFEGSTEVWYGDNGKPIFGFHREMELAELDKAGPQDPFVTEWRTYFDGEGKPIFQSVRQASVKDASAPLPASLDRLPQDFETITAESYADPQAWFASTGCGGGGE